MKFRTWIAALSLYAGVLNGASATVSLADIPLFTDNKVAPNLMFALSVEWPTGVVAAYRDQASTDTGWTCSGRNSDGYGICYYDNRRYLGYFDPESCYNYTHTWGGTTYNTPETPLSGSRTVSRAATEYFVRSGAGTGTNKHVCSSAFSGNFLNWATMHAADTFRFALTGGDRYKDNGATAGSDGSPAYLTVLEKGRDTGEGKYTQFPIKYINSSSNVAPSTVSPYSWTNLYVRVNNEAELNPFSDSATRGRVVQISNNSSFSHNGSSKLTYTFMGRVKVCDSTYREYETLSNDYQLCQQYTNGNYKPVGIIQKNASVMRFGVTSYTYSRADTPPSGGVLRSRMKSLGTTYVNSESTNPYAEWDSATGVLKTHPDSTMLSSTDTNSGKVTQSGVINYINRFGKNIIGDSAGYRRRDTFSELYYASLRYLRNMTPLSSYLTGLTDDSYDKFPIVQSAADESNVNLRPIQYYCQQSNILGIADSNTHTDVDVPGNTLTSVYSGHQTNSGSADSVIDVMAMAKKLNTMEGITKFTGYLSSSRYSTYHVASLAYWANTHDILTDNSSKAWTSGTQNVKSYFVDVQESGSDGNSAFDSNGVPTTKNQIFYAAKYGGFDDYNVDGVPANQSTWGNSVGFPNNLFYGSRPDLIISALGTVVNNALARSLTSAGASMSTVNYSTDSTGSSGAYVVSYISGTKYWTGDIKGYRMTVSDAGDITLNYKWSAKEKLDAQTWSNRLIVTSKATNTLNPGVPFTSANLTTAQQTALTPSVSGATLANAISYLRGDSTYESTYFRKRQNRLGDIVDSEATVVRPPSAAYTSDNGYSTFKTTYASRKRVIFAGANDGMLHAFDADVGSATADPGSTAGQELWAFIPSFVISGPTAPSTDGLIVRTSLSSFDHKFYVNSTPVTADVDFNNTRGNKVGSGDGDWRTILVGGLGKGGKGYYAIDVTDPTSWTSEANVAGKVLWEFTDADMGFSYGKPIIAKTARDGWVVILSSGYNNSSSTGYLYIVNPKTGALIQKIAVGTGSDGFAHPEAFLPSTLSYTIDYVYGGDLNGNVWRFDLRSSTADTYSSPVKIAKLINASGDAQPITTAPKIEIGSDGVKRWVFVGTGKLLDTSDMSSSSQQTFYAIRDGSKSSVYGSGTGETALPSIEQDGGKVQITAPVGRGKMVAVTDLTVGVVADSAKPMGWYYDLSTSTGVAERITSDLTANEGLISWTGYISTSADPCSPGASSNVYVVDYDNAVSRLTDSDGNVVSYYSSTSTLVKVQFIKTATGKIKAVFTSGDATLGSSQIQKLTGNFGSTAGKAIRLNWREIMN